MDVPWVCFELCSCASVDQRHQFSNNSGVVPGMVEQFDLEMLRYDVALLLGTRTAEPVMMGMAISKTIIWAVKDEVVGTTFAAVQRIEPTLFKVLS